MANQSTKGGGRDERPRSIFEFNLGPRYVCDRCKMDFGADWDGYQIHCRWYEGRRCDLYGPNAGKVEGRSD
jgi:hypothetical protein